MISTALSSEEEAKNLLYWRGLALEDGCGQALLLKEMSARGQEKSPGFLGPTSILTPGSCLCLGQSYSIKAFAVPTSSLVTFK